MVAKRCTPLLATGALQHAGAELRARLGLSLLLVAASACYGSSGREGREGTDAPAVGGTNTDGGPNADGGGAAGGGGAGSAGSQAGGSGAGGSDVGGRDGEDGRSGEGGAGGEAGAAGSTDQPPPDEPLPDAGSSLADASARSSEFLESCVRFEQIQHLDSCVECTSAASAETCGAEQIAFARECGHAERCYARNCGSVCGPRACAERCDCADTCLPVGDSHCKGLWAALLSCVAETCRGC